MLGRPHRLVPCVLACVAGLGVPALAGAVPALVAASSAGLGVDANGDGAAGPGDQIAHSVTVTNAGDLAAGAVAVDVVPDPLSAVVIGSVATTAGAVARGNAPGETTARVEAGALVAGASVTVTLRTLVPSLPVPVGQLSTRVTITSADTPPITLVQPVPLGPGDPGGAIARAPGDAVLSVALRGPTRPRAGSTARYCTTVANRGAAVARAVSVRLPLPAGLRAIGTSRRARAGADVLVWAPRRLAPAARLVSCARIRVAGPAGALRGLRVGVSAANADGAEDTLRVRVRPAG